MSSRHQPIVTDDDGDDDLQVYSSQDTPLYDPSHRDSRDSIDESILNRDVLEKDPRFLGDAEEGEGYTYARERRRGASKRHSRTFLIALLSIIGTASLIGFLSASGFHAPIYGRKGGDKHITLDHLMNGTFAERVKRVDWVKEAGDGVYSTRTPEGHVILEDIARNRSQTVLVNATEVIDADGNQLYFQDWRLSADMKYILLKRDYRKQWRHSSFGNFYVHRLEDGITFPLDEVVMPAQVALAVWAPVGHNVAFVRGNDVYVVDGVELDAFARTSSESPRHVRVTADGSTSVLNGVNSWVYEEEVLQTAGALWWNPRGDAIAFLRQDETDVRDYTLQYYNPNSNAFTENPYPYNFMVKYPTPGTPNPIVSVWTWSKASAEAERLQWKALPEDDQVIMSVDWVGSHDLLVKETDRASKRGQAVLFQGSTRGKAVRTLGRQGEEGDDGWIDHNQHIELLEGDVSGYLDIVPKDGYNHIALFSPVNASTPVWITSGEWEVAGGILGWDASRRLAYFMAAKPSTERHLHSARVPDDVSMLANWEPEITALTDVNTPGYYSASFSPGSGYYALHYQGPEVPWQHMIDVEADATAFVLEDNAALNATSAEYCRPLISYETIESDGLELNVVELLPPGFDASGHRHKYPVLFNPYGGPGSQSADTKFRRDWHHYLACELKIIVVTVDGRGTGFKGRALRNPIRDRVGDFEARDQINAAREWAKKRYVDTHKIGIWGWSFGGFLTLKALEFDSGVFTLGSESMRKIRRLSLIVDRPARCECLQWPSPPSNPGSNMILSTRSVTCRCHPTILKATLPVQSTT